MICDYPIMVDNARYGHKKFPAEMSKTPVPCGRCQPCRSRITRQWIFRLKQEYRDSMYAHFVTLTYDGEHVPISDKKMMNLNKKDVQDFIKRLRHTCTNTLKYYAVGEYGSRNNRPHYHMILFNFNPEGDETDVILKVWKNGSIHVGEVNEKTIAYTCKYLDKKKRIPMFKGDTRQKEFSLSSNGLGKGYLTESMKKWHKNDVSRNYVLDRDTVYKIPLPKYYRDKIYTGKEVLEQRELIEKVVLDNEAKDKIRFERLYPDGNYFKYLNDKKRGRQNKLFNSSKNRTI